MFNFYIILFEIILLKQAELISVSHKMPCTYNVFLDKRELSENGYNADIN